MEMPGAYGTEVESSPGARIKAPREVRCGRGYSLITGEGAVTPPQRIFQFLSSKRRVLVHSG